MQDLVYPGKQLGDHPTAFRRHFAAESATRHTETGTRAADQIDSGHSDDVKEISSDQETLFDLQSASIGSALDAVNVALDFLWEDETRSIHDKVAGPFDYEELLAALLFAREGLEEALDLQAEVERLGDQVEALET